jgi:hypothetical protein
VLNIGGGAQPQTRRERKQRSDGDDRSVGQSCVSKGCREPVPRIVRPKIRSPVRLSRAPINPPQMAQQSAIAPPAIPDRTHAVRICEGRSRLRWQAPRFTSPIPTPPSRKECQKVKRRLPDLRGYALAHPPRGARRRRALRPGKGAATSWECGGCGDPLRLPAQEESKLTTRRRNAHKALSRNFGNTHE